MPVVCQLSLDIADRQFASVEHRGGEHGVRAGVDRRGEILDPAGAAARDDRHRRHLAHEPHELEVETVLRAVGIDGVDEQLPRAPFDHLAGPVDGIERRLPAAAVRRHDEPGRGRRRPLHVEGEHEHLRAEPVGDLADEIRAQDRRAVDADLVRPAREQSAHVFRPPHAAADGERDEHLLGRGANDVVGRVAVVDRRRHVEEGDLVRTLLVVAAGELDRVAGVAQVLEIHALHDAPGGNIEARDHAHRNGHG
jgi:hypothetical protein